jgi:hypothetical protein
MIIAPHLQKELLFSKYSLMTSAYRARIVAIPILQKGSLFLISSPVDSPRLKFDSSLYKFGMKEKLEPFSTV